VNIDKTLRKLIPITTVLLVGCGGIDDEETLNVFNPLPASPVFPVENKSSESKIELGRMLFWDPILSGNKDVACATCHHPEKGYADALPLSLGVGGYGLGDNRAGGAIAKRNASTILNSAFNGISNQGNYTAEQAPMFWDNRVVSLEHQAMMPILSKEEMRGGDISEGEILSEVISRLKGIPQYGELFERAFGSPEISEQRLFMAIATFERTLIANNSRFDRYLRGDQTALNQLEQQGMQAFVEVGCAECHSGPMLSDYQLHVVGTPETSVSLANHGVDRGAGEFQFRTPTLRNLNVTAPYMHNGIFDTLEEVVEFYEQAAEGENIHSSLNFTGLAVEVRNLEMEGEDGNEGDDGLVASLVAFMKTLEDDSFDKEIPVSVPSGLNPGGNI